MTKIVKYRTHDKNPQILYLPQEGVYQTDKLINMAGRCKNFHEVAEKMNKEDYFNYLEDEFFDDIAIKANYISKVGHEKPRALKLLDDLHTMIGVYEIARIGEREDISKKDKGLFFRVNDRFLKRIKRFDELNGERE